MRNWRLIQGSKAAIIEIGDDVFPDPEDQEEEEEEDEPDFGDGDDDWYEEDSTTNIHVWVPTPHFVITIMAICLTGLIGYAMYLIGGR